MQYPFRNTSSPLLVPGGRKLSVINFPSDSPGFLSNSSQEGKNLVFRFFYLNDNSLLQPWWQFLCLYVFPLDFIFITGSSFITGVRNDLFAKSGKKVHFIIKLSNDPLLPRMWSWDPHIGSTWYPIPGFLNPNLYFNKMSRCFVCMSNSRSSCLTFKHPA